MLPSINKLHNIITKYSNPIEINEPLEPHYLH